MMYLSAKPKFWTLHASTPCSHAPAVNNTDRHYVFPTSVLNATSEILHTRICSFTDVVIKLTAFFKGYITSTHVLVRAQFKCFILSLYLLCRGWQDTYGRDMSTAIKKKKVNIMQKLITLKSLEVSRKQLRKYLNISCDAANRSRINM